MTADAPPPPPPAARRRQLLSLAPLALSAGLGVSCAVISISVVALFAATIVETPALASLPYGAQFFALMAAAYFGALAAARWGRKRVVLVFAAAGVLAGICGAAAVRGGSLPLLVGAHCLLGVFLAGVQMLRFSALDMVAAALRPLAMSLVMFGGVFAAVVGPLFARHGDALFSAGVYESAYRGIILLAAVVFLLLSLSALPKKPPPRPARAGGAARTPLFALPHYPAALLCGGVGYGVMNILMLTSGLHMREAHDFSFHHVSWSIQAHVLLMFAPSFVTGRLIARWGARRVLYAGLVLQLASAAAGAAGESFAHFLAALLLLGLSWNFLYLGGSYLAAAAAPAAEKYRAQGACDAFISLTATLSALSSAGLLAFFGWSGLNIFVILLTLLLAAYVAGDFGGYWRRRFAGWTARRRPPDVV